MNLAIELRPKTLDEYLGQSHIKSQLEKMGFPKKYDNQCFIISGKSGIGKTTLAKIMAKMLNANTVEINGATQARKDNIREIIDNLSKRPIGYDKHCLIIDEAHGVRKEAMGALLLFLENLPKYVIIIMCTTELEKIPITITSRCYGLNLMPIEEEILLDNLMNVNSKYKYKVDYDVLKEIAKKSEGSVRESLKLLTQYVNTGILRTLKESDIAEIISDLMIAFDEPMRMKTLINSLEMGFSAKYILTEMIKFTFYNEKDTDLCKVLLDTLTTLSEIKEFQEDLLIPTLVTNYVRRFK